MFFDLRFYTIDQLHNVEQHVFVATATSHTVHVSITPTELARCGEFCHRSLATGSVSHSTRAQETYTERACYFRTAFVHACTVSCISNVHNLVDFNILSYR